MKYLLDFDDTLYDTVACKRQVAADGNEHLLFTPEMWQHYDVREYLHADTVAWLQTKAKHDLYIVTAAMAREGTVHMAYQKEKLRCSQLTPLVQEVVFAVGEKGEVAAEIASQFPPAEPIIFVDDRIEQCLSVQAALPNAIICLMVRDPHPNPRGTLGPALGFPSGSEVQGIHVVHDLAMVDAIIKTL